jgi:hypothetical protein
MDLSRRSGLLALAGSMIEAAPTRKARVAFHYEAVFPPQQASWYTGFSVLVTGGILDRRQTAQLLRTGSRLVAYEWIAGFYPDTPSAATPKWQSTLVRSKSKLLLNSSPIGGGAAISGRKAFWYDFGYRELLSERAEELSRALIKNKYAGYFFDTLGWEHLPPGIQRRFREAHPDLDYETQQGRFLKQLRELLPPGKLIFLNQGYRNAKVYLPYANFDLSESSFTYLRERGTGFRPWRNPRSPADSIDYIMSDLILPSCRRFPTVKMVHLNYAAGEPASVRRAIDYSFASAKIFNHDAYLVCPGSPSLEERDIYFEDLGAPLATEFSEDPATAVAWREFRRGVVAINTGTSTAQIPGLKLVLADPPRGYIFR